MPSLASLLSNASSVATIIGVIGVALAWRSYRVTVDSAKSSHMNALFRDYLRLQFDFFNADKERPRDGNAWRSLFSYKMWVLEEIWIWVDDQRFRSFPVQPRRSEKHRCLLIGWHDTLVFHLKDRPSERGWREFIANEGCYAPGFVAFVSLHHPHSPTFGKTGGTIDCRICGKPVAAEPAWLSECLSIRRQAASQVQSIA